MQLHKKQLKKQDYVTPLCEVIKVKEFQVICASVTPNTINSEEEDYEDGGEHEGGAWEF